MAFSREYEEKKQAFEAFFYPLADRITAPEPLKSAMLYALKSGGKRLRPVLLVEACRLFRAPDDDVYTAAAAVECIHTYSLVHDDLPAMDNDDLRRGKPTVHKVYGDGMAVLTGDALLNFAFELLFALADKGGAFARAGRMLADACGAAGLIGGQSLDIGAAVPDKETLDYIYRHKTGDLIAAAINAGAVLGGADEAQRARLEAYGYDFGFAFQIADDLLDEGEDKNTYVRLYGVPAARAAIEARTAAAVSALKPFGRSAAFFEKLARKSIRRKV